MAATATDLTREHYQRPEVREIITKFAMPGQGNWRALNGDFHCWYRYRDAPAGHEARLLNAIEDYEELTKHYRTFYATLNVFDKNSWMAARLREEITSDNPLGTPADTVAYTLGVDIDKGHGCNIEDPETRQAVEAAAQYLVDYLKEHGIHKNVWVLFSGGGIYVQIHHEICRPKSQLPDDRRAFFEELTDRYNRLIKLAEMEFFKAHREYIGKVKYDALNNSKRVFKCILSIHKKKPYAVTPLNRDAIKIDFERARVPLRDDMIAEARTWYSTCDPAEREPLLKLLDEFREPEEEKKRSKHHFSEIWRSPFKIDTKYFPPCIKHIIDIGNPGEGKTRSTAVLSAFLYQMGWEEEDAWNLTKAISDRNGLGNADHIFDSVFGRISCPSCQKIQDDGAGYPHLGLKGLGCCQPEEECSRWPGDYAVAYALGDMQTATKKIELKAEGPTVLDAFASLLQHEADIAKSVSWSWRMHKPRIQRVMANPRALSEKGEEKAHKFLKEFKKDLEKFGIDYDDLYPIPRRPKSKKEEFDWRIKAKAWKTLRTGDPVQYIADSCGKMVLGAGKAFKKLTCGISIQNINQSYGFHPKLNGDSSGGKTYTVYTFAHHMPKEAVIKGSMSAKAGFYHHDGNRVFRILDDYQAGNEDLDTVIKQTSSEFHSTYKHRTVVNHMAAVMEIGSEQTWAITSVDASQEIQVLNRQMPINVDDSVKLTEAVNSLTIKRYAEGERQYPVTKNVLVSRCILQILRENGYIDVRVPFGDRIEWLDTTNRRNPSLFMDLVVAFTGMFRFQREKDAEGYYLATEDDFNAAKALFTDNDGEELVRRLTKKERETLEFLVSRPEGITQDDLAEKLKVSRQRAGHILFGRDKERGGLMQKVQLKEERRSEMTKITAEHSQTIHRTVYSLKDYDKFAGFDGVVRLKPQRGPHETHAPTHETPHATIDTTTKQPHETIEIEKEKEREEREAEGGLPTSSTSKDPGLQENVKNGCKGFTGSTDADGHGCVRGDARFHEASNAPRDADNHGCIGSEKPPRTDPETARTMPNQSADSGSIKADLLQAGRSVTPAAKDHLWDSIQAKLKKYGRVDGRRRGLAVGDLRPDEAELVLDAGWTQETIETGVSIWWAPEKTLKAMGLEAPA